MKNPQNRGLENERDAATNKLASFDENLANLNAKNTELLKLRGELALLKQRSIELSNKLIAASHWGLGPEELPPVRDVGVPLTAKAYARLVKKSSAEQLSAAEEFNLLKAWPYLDRRFSTPDAFGFFQAEYLAAILDIKDDNVKWQLRRILERARNRELAFGLSGPRLLAEEFQSGSFNPNLQKTRDQWNALSQTTSQQIVELLPEAQRGQFAPGWPVLDFDPRLKAGSNASLADPRFQNLDPKEVFEAFMLADPNVHYGPIGVKPKE